MARPRLPSITALQAFESAALRLSFSQAAGHLNVTAAAISQQVRSLELQLGVKLFVRRGRGVQLTKAGRAWLPEVQECLAHVKNTVDFARQHSSNVLTITVAPSMASRWLMSRLYRFSERFPEISVRVIATPELIDVRDQEVDLALRFGPGGYQGVRIEFLMPEFLVPMCTPELSEKVHPLNEPNDLKHHRLIHDDSLSVSGGGWSLWLRAAGASEVNSRLGPKYSLADIALQEAIEGRGVALARWQLAVSDVHENRLVCPFDLAIESPYSYYLIMLEDAARHEKVKAFRQWLLEEAEELGTPHISLIAPSSLQV